MYEDCNVFVGCVFYGCIDNINSVLIWCVCDDGYVSDYNVDIEILYCCLCIVCDVMYDESFFLWVLCVDG